MADHPLGFTHAKDCAIYHAAEDEPKVCSCRPKLAESDDVKKLAAMLQTSGIHALLYSMALDWARKGALPGHSNLSDRNIGGTANG